MTSPRRYHFDCAAPGNWAQREWTNLRRIKLEALLEKTHECEDYLDRRLNTALEGKAAIPERDYVNELDVIATLYFPELKNEVDQFVGICRAQHIPIIELGQAVLGAKGDGTAFQAAVKNFKSQWDASKLSAARHALTAAARSLVERIMNVDAAPARAPMTQNGPLARFDDGGSSACPAKRRSRKS
jgi:hypothetical protein